MAKTADPSRFVLTRSEIAEALGCTARNVSHLVADGLPRRADGRFDLKAVFQWQAARLKVKAAASVDRSQAIKDRLVEAQRQKIDLEIAAMRGQMIPLATCGVVLNRIASLVATQLDSLGPRLAGELADEDDPRKVQAALLREGRATRRAISEALRELSRDVESGEAFED